MTEETQGQDAPSEDTRASDAEAEDTATKEGGNEAENQDTDADDAGDTEADEDSDDGDAEPPKRKSRARERIRELNRRLRQEEAMNAQLFAKLREQEMASKPQEQASAAASPPREEDYDTTEQWVDALTDWKLDQREKARAAEAQEQQTRDARQQPIQELVAKLEAADPDILDDFHQDVRPDLAFSEMVLTALNDTENPAAVMRWLGKNPGRLKEIAGFSPTKAGRELARIEAGLAKPKPKKATDAPPPEGKVRGRTADTVKSPDDMTIAEYREWRNRQIRQKAG